MLEFQGNATVAGNVATAQGAAALVERGVAADDIVFLPKPYTLAQIAETVKENIA